MNHTHTIRSKTDNKVVEFLTSNSGQIEVRPMFDDGNNEMRVSRAFPFKSFKTTKGANRFAAKFLSA